MSSNYLLTDNEEIYIITLHRHFKINVLQLINDLNNRMDHDIPTRVTDIKIMVNTMFNTDLSVTTVNEIINRLNNGELKQLFHSYDVDQLLTNYIASSISDTNATLSCLKPFTNTCLTCKQELQISFNQYVTIYNMGSIIKGGVYYSSCNNCRMKYYPNYYEHITIGAKFVTPASIYNQKYIYFGGKKVYSTELLIHFTSAFLRQYSGFENFQNSYNLTIKKYITLSANTHTSNEIMSEISREYFSNIWFIYQLCLFTFFMNDTLQLEIPKLLDDLSIYKFFDVNYDQWYSDFVNHWAIHHRTHPCDSTKQFQGADCMTAFVVDGMQKVARVICNNKNKMLVTSEFPDGIYVGCGNTPKSKSGLCERCKEEEIIHDNETYLKTNDDKGIYDDPTTGCNVSREDRFVDMEKKISQGIIYTLSPCGIIIGFDEFIYLFWNRYDKIEINRRILQTPSSNLISRCLFFIDRFHQQNHKRPMCQKERNIDYAYKGAIKINTEAAEQRNSILKQYQNALSSYSSKKIRITYLILFHLMNAERNMCDGQFEYNRNYAQGNFSANDNSFNTISD
ncbi:hypothetical protein I4U23_017026 [Adineta vaga]|nr:hypothetical protein I4U23_017026 [Adineta vaga]